MQGAQPRCPRLRRSSKEGASDETHAACRHPLVRGGAGRGYTGGSRFRAGVQRLAVATALAVALMAIVGAPGALAAGQEHNHFRDVFTDVDDDFCGTGGSRSTSQATSSSTSGRLRTRATSRARVSGKISLTNPLTGDIAINHFAVTNVVVNISGDPEGDHVH